MTIPDFDFTPRTVFLVGQYRQCSDYLVDVYNQLEQLKVPRNMITFNKGQCRMHVNLGFGHSILFRYAYNESDMRGYGGKVELLEFTDGAQSSMQERRRLMSLHGTYQHIRRRNEVQN